jgi:hypothetical protein
VPKWRNRHSSRSVPVSGLRFDHDLYEVARLELGPDSAAGARSLADALRLVGQRHQEWRQARARAKLGDSYPEYPVLRDRYPAVLQVEIFNTDAVARLVMFGALSDDPAVGPSQALLEMAISALGPRKSLANLGPGAYRGILGLETAVIGHVFYRLGQLADAIALGQAAVEILMEQRTEDGRERAALVLAVDVLAFARTATGESELALGWLDQALVHLRVLADQGYDVRSAIASHLELRRPLADQSVARDD